MIIFSLLVSFTSKNRSTKCVLLVNGEKSKENAVSFLLVTFASAHTSKTLLVKCGKLKKKMRFFLKSLLVEALLVK